MRRLVSFCLFFHFPTFIPYFSISKLIVFHLLKTFFRKPFVRSESSALSLRHIKTTVFTVVFGTLVHQRARRAYGNRAVSTTVRFRVGITKADTSVSALWYSRIAASTPSVRESGCVNSRSILRRDSKSRHKSVCFLVLPTGIEPITNP